MGDATRQQAVLDSQRVEDVIMALAARQHGVVTRAQLLRAGVAPDVLDRRAKRRQLRRVHQGVYLVGPIVALRAREMAAVLASGAGAVLSHWSAAQCWPLVPACEQPGMHVLVAGHRPAARRGINVHLVGALSANEITTHDHIPITTPARTLLDLAGCVEVRELERALAEAFALRLTSAAELGVLLGRHTRRPGARRLQIMLQPDARPALTRSQAEEEFLMLIRKADMPDPESNVRLEGYEVDFYWRAERLVVEIDGRAFHSSDRTFESDRRRDAALLAAGLRVMRVTWRQIVKEREALLARLIRALASASRS